jgi:DNA (cytosine-5)-methyltransferase 1
MKKIKINHLDLFSGIGGFHLGFEKAGFEVNSYFSEVDKYAIDVYKNNFKNSNYVGSVTDVRGTQLPKIDAITFGSPCQDFSLAGKRKGMGGQRSSLITEAIRLIDECRPRFFVWENVKGTFSSNNGEDFWAIIQAFTNLGGYRLEWQLLNTKWFLPQNRERIYLVGYLGDGCSGQVFPIRESSKQTNELQGQQINTCCLTTRYGADGNGSYLIERKLNAQKVEIGTLRTHNDGKGFRKIKDGDCPTIPARAREDGSGQPIIKINSATSKGYEEASEGDSINFSNPNLETRRGRVGKGVAQTLDTACNQAVIGAMRGRYNKDNKTEQQIEINKNGTSNTLTAVTKDNLVLYDNIPEIVKVRKHKIDAKELQQFLKKHRIKSIKQISKEINVKKTKVEHWFRKDKCFAIPDAENWFDLKKCLNIKSNLFDKKICEFIEKESVFEKTNRVYKTNGISPTLTATSADERIINENKIRRLTPIECERLQGFPDNWTEYGESGKISDTQRYKMCGNAVTVDVVEAVASSIINTIY